MIHSRKFHRAIVNYDEIWVVGGKNSDTDSLPLERCTPTDTDMNCVAQSELLTKYERYPELFLVSDSFCSTVETTAQPIGITTAWPGEDELYTTDNWSNELYMTDNWSG